MLLACRTAYDAGEQGNFGIRHTAIFKAIVARQFAKSVANELVDHSFRIVTSLFALKERLNRGHARCGAGS